MGLNSTTWLHDRPHGTARPSVLESDNCQLVSGEEDSGGVQKKKITNSATSPSL